MPNIKRASLEEIKRMHDRGELWPTRPDAPEMPEDELPGDFWETAEVMYPEDWEKRSVHLRLEPEVFDYFKAGGKGHLTRMQNVLKAYVKAKQNMTGEKPRKKRAS